MDSFYTSHVTVSPTEMEAIELQMQGQSESELWREERHKRLTASLVGGICKLRQRTKRSKKVETILYSKFGGNQATRYGQDMEELSQSRYTIYHNDNGNPGLKIKCTGLAISNENPWIAASPDDREYDPTSPNPYGLAEYKHP